MQKLSITEGAIFLVPLSTTGFGVGVLIRADGKGRAYGAFFGPRVAEASEVDISLLREERAVLRCKFGDHGLHTRRWPVVGVISDWETHRWPLPKFARRHDNPKLCYVTTYDDSLNAIEEVLQSCMATTDLPEDTQFGSGVVEAKLAKYFAQS